MDYPAGESVTLVSTTTTFDRYGNGSTTTIETAWGPCAVWDRFATEQANLNSVPVVIGLAIAGPRVAINSDDRVIRGGVTYEVDGEPLENTVSPFTGWDPGIVVNVKRAGGV